MAKQSNKPRAKINKQKANRPKAKKKANKKKPGAKKSNKKKATKKKPGAKKKATKKKPGAKKSNKKVRQFPIDTKEAAWAEVRVVNPSGQRRYIGYMLAAGSSVGSTTLDTTKGSIDVFQPATEYWFGASQDEGEAASNDTVEFTVLALVDVVRNGWSAIEAAIDNSSPGLRDLSGALSPVFIGAAGAVPWSNRSSDLPRVQQGPTYSWSSSPKWNLTIVQTGTTLDALYWSNDGSNDFTAMPTVGPTLTNNASPSPTLIYIGYFAP